MALSAEAIMAECQRQLEEGGYRVTRETAEILEVSSDRVLLAEDPYSIVSVVLYDTWTELVQDWPSAQGSLVEAISKRLSRAERKTWEGYLVLITPALAADSEATANAIRYDTTRVRKLVATGEDLQTLGDVGRTLLPLMPLEAREIQLPETFTLLDRLPDLLNRRGLDARVANVLVEAFRKRLPILEELDKALKGPSS